MLLVSEVGSETWRFAKFHFSLEQNSKITHPQKCFLKV